MSTESERKKRFKHLLVDLGEAVLVGLELYQPTAYAKTLDFIDKNFDPLCIFFNNIIEFMQEDKCP